jgi:hypothetical protein
MTAQPGPAPVSTGWAVQALRRAIGVLHHLHQENRHASEAIFRPAGAPRPRADAPAGPAAPAVSATAPAERVS